MITPPVAAIGMFETATAIARAGVPFLWLGSALAISFLEVGLSLRSGICQQAFRSLDVGEVVLAAVLTVAVFADAARSPIAAALVVALWVVLGSQVALLRPRLACGSSGLLGEDTAAGPPLQSPYLRLQVAKLVGLAVLGCLLVPGAG